MKLVECWIEHPIRSLDQTFTYICREDVSPGCRVLIALKNANVTGFVEKVTETDETREEIEKRLGFPVKEILSVIDRESLITKELHDLAEWMHAETLSTMISCFASMLPSKAKPSSSHKQAVMEKWVKISENEVALTPKQLEAFLYVKKQGECRYSEVRKLFPNQAKALVDKDAFILYEKEKEGEAIEEEITSVPFLLTDTQKQAMQEIEDSSDPVYLIRGVTGSGKTEVYLQLAAKALAEGKQVLILVPEIALTPQMIERVSSRFGKGLAIYHSGLNPQEKYEQYRMVKNKKAKIVVGTRSAVFLPFHDLGLIVMDEEHDSSYKQDRQPSYHCRDIAIWRGKYHGCKVILGSATPTLESYARGMKKVYHLVTMDQRVNRELPEVTIVPLKDTIRKGESYILSDVLKDKLHQRLENHQQSIILLNRRGYSSALRCRSCQEVIQCPHCDIAMSYHKDVKRMKCHSCGFEMAVPSACPSCGENAGFSSYGFGTQRLEDEVKTVFPQARILRMDADTTTRKNSHKAILESFGKGEADILLGTQMIAKGLDFPKVTLVGVVNGDEGLNRLDFHSCETTFDLLMQAGGRSGRSKEKGEVVFQVYDPDHYAVVSAANQDYLMFFKNEMQFRHAGQYPPYTYMIALTVAGYKQENVEHLAELLYKSIRGPFKTIGVISLLKINDRFRNRIILKGKDLAQMQQAVRQFMNTTKENLNGLQIDVNPLYLD